MYKRQVVWSFGVQWAFTQFVTAALAVTFYRRGAGGTVTKGVIPLIALIVIGVLGSFFVCVGVDAYQYWASHDMGVPATTFVLTAITDPVVLGGYGRDLAFFVLFGAIGTFSTLRSLRRKR